jgi:hypothetical protein
LLFEGGKCSKIIPKRNETISTSPRIIGAGNACCHSLKGGEKNGMHGRMRLSSKIACGCGLKKVQNAGFKFFCSNLLCDGTLSHGNRNTSSTSINTAIVTKKRFFFIVSKTCCRSGVVNFVCPSRGYDQCRDFTVTSIEPF